MKKEIKYREVKPSDSRAVVDLLNKIDNETDYLLFEPGERPTTPERILEIINTPHETIFVADTGESLVGYLLLFGKEFKRKKHRAELIVAVSEKYRDQGIGKKLIALAEDWSKAHGIRRLELTVCTLNIEAYKLYKRLGYETEGEIKKSTFVNGEFRDDYLMAKFFCLESTNPL